MKLIGREDEQKSLLEAFYSDKSEMIAIYGRRRVGKTFLVKETFDKKLCFSMSGIHNANLNEQLTNFLKSLNLYQNKKIKNIPHSWFEAFDLLKIHIEQTKSKSKHVLFIDELPWLDTPKSKFTQALEHFWNSWADGRKDIVLIICGSAASWMIKKILNNKGGLHNRVTKRIRLMPFNLYETEQFLIHKKINLPHYDISKIYMAMGGIPFYLNELHRGESVAQNIERICFNKDGLLRNEFDNLYSALFNNSNKHIQFIKVLASAPQGLNRNQIIAKSKLVSGGGISDVFNELLESGFISEIQAKDKLLKNSIYRLTDEYSLFYLKFIQPNKITSKGVWNNISKTQSYISWCGYAFENLAFKHSASIKKALGISGIYTNVYSWQNKHSQIDMLIDRDDNSVNICEIKYYQTEFEINKSYAQKLENKILNYKKHVSNKKSVFLTFITTYGIKENLYNTSLVDNSLTINDLFFSEE